MKVNSHELEQIRNGEVQNSSKEKRAPAMFRFTYYTGTWRISTNGSLQCAGIEKSLLVLIINQQCI